MEEDLKFFNKMEDELILKKKMEADLNFLTKCKMTSNFQQNGRQPQLYNKMEEDLNFQPIKDNLISIYKMECKLNFGAKWSFKQAQLDLSLSQLSPSLFEVIIPGEKIALMEFQHFVLFNTSHRNKYKASEP